MTLSVLTLNPAKLTEHPLLASIPVLEEHAPEFQALLASVRDVGVETPIFVDEHQRILDGRNRVRAAALAGREVPAIERPSAEAGEIIVRALANRRHLPKGALAYLLVPLFPGAVEERRARRLANLRQGPKPTQSASGAVGVTVDQFAAENGFSKDLFEQAVKVRKLFESTKPREWRDGARTVEKTVKGWFEPRLLSGEIGLGGILQAVAGKDSTEGQTPAKRELSLLIRRGFADLGKRFGRWESLGVGDRRTLAREAAVEAAKWPEDVRQAVLASLETAAAHKPAKPGF